MTPIAPTLRPALRPSFKPIAAAAALAFAPALASCGVAEAQTGAASSASASADSQAAPQSASQETSDETTRQCFFARQVNGFRNVEDEDGQRIDTRVLIDVGARDTYEFELLRRCPSLRFARSIALERTGPGRICDGLDVDLIVNDTLNPDRCRVTMVRKLDPEEADARAGERGR